MMIHSRRLTSLLLAPLALAFAFACGQPAAAADPEADLIARLKGADVKGYLFAMNEDPATSSSALTNPAVAGFYMLPKTDTNVVLRYSSVTDAATGKVSTYKAEVVKKGTAVSLLLSDVASGKVLSNQQFPPATPACSPAFSSLSACIDRFRCMNAGALQCAANTTCQPQLADVDCCLTNGQEFDVLMIFPPTSLICSLRANTIDLGGLALSVK
jgi:hypothetical protein